jgi:hypothetical protein
MEKHISGFFQRMSKMEKVATENARAFSLRDRGISKSRSF